jgi:Ca2+-binding RTX toxin-like protein
MGGVDTMVGGLGNDTYHVSNDDDETIELAGQGIDTVVASVTDAYTLSAQVENLVLVGGNIDGHGNTLNNAIIGTDGDNLLDGGAGGDRMSGGAGDDTYVVDNALDLTVEAADGGSDTVVTSIAHTLSNYVEDLRLAGTSNIAGTGNALANRIIGNRGANALDGGLGNDILLGGLGNDTLTGGEGNDLLNAGNGNDRLLGGAGNDRLYAGTGTNILDGGDGVDIANYSYFQAGVTVDLNITAAQLVNESDLHTLIGIESVYGSNVGDDELTGNAGSNALYGLAGADMLAGGAGNDTLAGGEDNDWVEGGLGNDRLDGGDGADTADYYAATSGVTIDLNLQTAQNTVGAGIDTFLRIENINGTRLGHDLLAGSADDNILCGYGGNDTLVGGAGSNFLDGRDGNDVFRAHEGNDVIEGGGGTDMLDYSLALGPVTVMLETGTRTNSGDFGLGDYDRVPSYTPGVTSIVGQAAGGGSDTLADIENVTGSNFDDFLSGSSVANVINGGVGGDIMIGGDGADIYYVDNTRDVVRETNVTQSSGGIDLVISTVSFTLGSNVENLRLNANTNINATGNALANTIYAGGGVNAIDGGGGTDTLSYVHALAPSGTTTGVTLDLSVVNTAQQSTASGISDNDLVKGIENITGSNYADVLTGSALANTLNGGAGTDRLLGMAGNDALNGGDGNDTLIGGAGNDELTGGAGNDAFVFNATLNATTNRDTVLDFVTASDKILLDDAIFSKFATTPVAAANLRQGTAAADSNDYLIYNKSTGALSYDADGNGGVHVAVQFATLIGNPDLTYSNFVII